MLITLSPSVVFELEAEITPILATPGPPLIQLNSRSTNAIKIGGSKKGSCVYSQPARPSCSKRAGCYYEGYLRLGLDSVQLPATHTSRTSGLRKSL